LQRKEYIPVTLELVFPVFGTTVATDHAYVLYAALSGVVPRFHDEDSPFRFAPITGAATPDGLLHIAGHSRLRVRLPDDVVRLALPLAGKRLALGDSTIRLGVPSLRALVAARSLIARMVTFKNAETPDEFLTTARAKLINLGVSGRPHLPIHLKGDRSGQPKRRVVRLKGVTIPGYSLIVTELSATDSLTLQESGLGGRTRLGCGFFTPVKVQQ
jgi:CRISPR-associated endonuclease/helicase Cas3